jgi:hypothetical protein
MNKKRILIILGIFVIAAITVLFLNIFLNPQNNISTQTLGGIVNIPNFQTGTPSTEKFCTHSGGNTPNETGSCTDNLGVHYDNCNYNILNKVYCENDGCTSQRINCEEYCQGICVTIAGRGRCICPG